MLLASGAPLYKGKFLSFPATGTLNPKEGTIEITFCPKKPAGEFENEWAFLFETVPAQEVPFGRNLLSICCFSGESNQRGIVASAAGCRATVDRETVIRKDVPVTLALSWGRKGVRLFVNGRPVGNSGKAPAGLEPMPGLFRVAVGAPYFARQMRISGRELEPEKLHADPLRPMEKSADTTLLWNGKDTALALPESWNSECRILPVWSLTESFSLPGEAAKLQLDGANFTSKEAVFELILTAGDGKVTRKTVRIAPRTRLQKITLSLPVSAPGHYPFTLEVRGPAGTRSYSFSHARINRTDANLPEGAFAEYIGHHLSDLPEVLKKMGITWSRGNAFKWFVVEPEPGKFDWQWSDWVVEQAEKNGIRLLGILGEPPAWAADPKCINTHKNAGRTGSRKPRSVADWEKYVEAVATRYKGRVPAWEIWNEVDWHPPKPAASFSGSTAEYFELLKAAYRAIRRADPEAKILVSGFGYGNACDQKMPFDLLDMGAANYCDYYNVHSYQGLWGIPELKQAVEKARPGMKLWQTEQMWHTIADPRAQAVLTAAIQFWFIEENFEKYFSFGEDFFFSHHTLSPIPAMPALAFCADMLKHCDRYTGVLKIEPASGYDLRHTFRRTDGTVLTVMGRTSITGRWRLEGDILAVYDLFGAPVALKDGVTERPTEFLYIVSRSPLKKIVEYGDIVNFCPNPSFEEISGDIAMGGLRNAKIEKWQFRSNTYDPAGEITVTRDAAKGHYAMQLKSSGKGRVYAFFDARLAGTGKFRLEGMFKNPGTQAIAPYVDVFERSSGYFKRYHAQPVEPEKGFVRRSVVMEIPKTTGTLVFSLGIEKAGTLIADELSLHRDQAPARELVSLALPAGKSATAVRGGDQVSTGELSKKMQSSVKASGFAFRPAARPQLLSKGAWRGLDGASVTIPCSGKAQAVVLLIGAAYVPAEAGVLGNVTIQYADATSAGPFPLRNGRELRDWFLASDRNGVPPAFRFVSTRMNEYGLFVVELPNPAPQKELRSIRLEAAGDALLILAAAGTTP